MYNVKMEPQSGTCSPAPFLRDEKWEGERGFADWARGRRTWLRTGAVHLRTIYLRK